jgi:hypothetical protein
MNSVLNYLSFFLFLFLTLVYASYCRTKSNIFYLNSFGSISQPTLLHGFIAFSSFLISITVPRLVIFYATRT